MTGRWKVVVVVGSGRCYRVGRSWRGGTATEPETSTHLGGLVSQLMHVRGKKVVKIVVVRVEGGKPTFGEHVEVVLGEDKASRLGLPRCECECTCRMSLSGRCGRRIHLLLLPLLPPVPLSPPPLPPPLHCYSGEESESRKRRSGICDVQRGSRYQPAI